jgi:cyclic pyranopterin phosphate synthase
MPEEGVELCPRETMLSLEDLAGLTGRFVNLFAINQVRITGGEPLIRKNVEFLVRTISQLPGLTDLSLTTNGEFLADKSQALADAGLMRVNVSLDSLDTEKYRAITCGGNLRGVFDGLAAARAVGLSPIKINVVLLPGFEEELQFVEWSNREGYLLRFIELMPRFAGGHRGFEAEGPKEFEILNRLAQRFDFVKEACDQPGRHVRRYRIPSNGWVFEFISGVSAPFCDYCNRLRLDCQGVLRSCLYGEQTLQLCPLLDATDEEFAKSVRSFVAEKNERSLDRIGGRMSSIGG